MTISLGGTARIPEDVLVSRLDEEFVLFNRKSGAYVVLDEAGSGFWELLTSSPSIQSAYETLLVGYDVDPDTLRANLTEFVDACVERGVIEVRNP